MEEPIVIKWKIDYNLSFYFAGFEGITPLWITNHMNALWVTDLNVFAVKEALLLLQPGVELDHCRVNEL